jgi:hypothetical protein
MPKVLGFSEISEYTGVHDQPSHPIVSKGNTSRQGNSIPTDGILALETKNAELEAKLHAKETEVEQVS